MRQNSELKIHGAKEVLRDTKVIDEALNDLGARELWSHCTREGLRLTGFNVNGNLVVLAEMMHGWDVFVPVTKENNILAVINALKAYVK